MYLHKVWFYKHYFPLNFGKVWRPAFYDFWIVNNGAVKNLGSLESIASGGQTGIPPSPLGAGTAIAPPNWGTRKENRNRNRQSINIRAPRFEFKARLCGRYWGSYFAHYSIWNQNVTTSRERQKQHSIEAGNAIAVIWRVFWVQGIICTLELNYLIITMAYTSVGSVEPDPMIERILLLKQEAYVYKIPPAQVLMNLLTYLLMRVQGNWKFKNPALFFGRG